MIWRLFKGRKAATESVVAETPAERLEQPSGERPKKLTPRLSAFRFEAPSRLGEEVASDTDIQEVAPSPPEHDFSSIVREKARKRRSVRVSDRGVRPMLVPSLRESTTRFKVIATKLSERKPTEAMHYWQDYLELRPQDADAWFSMGRCCLHLGYADEAQHAFQKTVNLDNEHSLALGALGYLAERQEDFPRAVQFYEQAVAFDEGNAGLVNELERLLRLTGHDERADLLARRQMC